MRAVVLVVDSSCICVVVVHLFVHAALLADMIRRNSGHIVAISSIQGKLAIPFRSACMSSFLLLCFIVIHF